MPLPANSMIFKFGDREHLESLQRGHVYMPCWRYFRDCDNQIERDENEGTHIWANPVETLISIGGVVLRPEDGALSASLAFSDRVTKIFCASVFQREVQRSAGPIFDDRVTKHGKSLLVIWDIRHFFDKLQRALADLRRAGILVDAREQLVEYFDPNTYDGPVGPFRKTRRFSFEKEWRIAVQKRIEDDEPFEFDIEPITAHSKIIPADSFVNRVDLRSDGTIQINV